MTNIYEQLKPSIKEEYLGKDEDGVDQYKYGKSHWFNHRGLTYIEKTVL